MRVAKIAVQKTSKSHRDATKPKLLRRETNEEIMHRSFLQRGFIRLRWQPGILLADSGNYVGVHGAAISVDCPDVKSAKEFAECVRRLIREAADKLKLSSRELQVSQR